MHSTCLAAQKDFAQAFPFYPGVQLTNLSLMHFLVSIHILSLHCTYFGSYGPFIHHFSPPCYDDISWLKTPKNIKSPYTSKLLSTESAIKTDRILYFIHRAKIFFLLRAVPKQFPTVK